MLTACRFDRIQIHRTNVCNIVPPNKEKYSSGSSKKLGMAVSDSHKSLTMISQLCSI